MRQGNGSDLLGANDPRSATIGIVYVAPNDDRESVQAAILTQEKLGREQIAIVLPNQNKAFHQSVDFDGLKNMRNKLQAKLVIVAPFGSNPAELARQRRFACFASLESYGRSLRDKKEAGRPDRTGRWPFSRRQAKPQFRDSPPVTAGEQRAAATPAAEDIDANPRPGAAAALTYDAAQAHDLVDEGAELPPLSQYNDAGVDVVLPAAPSPQAVDDTPATGAAPDTMQPPQPAQKPAEAGPAPGGEIITFPTRKRTTGEYAVTSASSKDGVTPTLVPQGGVGRRNSGKTPIVGAPTAGVTPAAAHSKVTTKLPTVGGKPPGAGHTAGGRGRGSGERWVLFVLLLLASLVLCATVAYAAPGALPLPVHNFFSNIAGGGTPAATVTITPRSADELNTYVLTGVTAGTPDRAKRQVQVRRLIYTTPPQSKTVPATGVVDTPSVQATGSLTFYNGNAFAYTVRAQTVFTDAHGVSVENNSAVVVPAGSPATGYGHTNAAATAISGGSSGNIPAGDFNLMQCCGSGSVFVSNGTFSGGQDPQHYTAVQQSDIDNAANPLKQPLTQSALAAVTGMKHANDQFVSKPSCTSKVTSNQAVGARATSVTVTFSATCTGEVYDQSAAQSIATDLLKTKATQDLDSTYAPVGNVTTDVTHVTNDPQGNLTLFVRAEGIWVYQFTAAQKTSLAQHIKGMNTQAALAYLQGQPGVGKVKITFNGSNTTTLPADPNAISIVIGNAPGVPGSLTPTSGPSSGITPTIGRGGSGITPTTAPATPFPSPSVGGS